MSCLFQCYLLFLCNYLLFVIAVSFVKFTSNLWVIFFKVNPTDCFFFFQCSSWLLVQALLLSTHSHCSLRGFVYCRFVGFFKVAQHIELVFCEDMHNEINKTFKTDKQNQMTIIFVRLLHWFDLCCLQQLSALQLFDHMFAGPSNIHVSRFL